MTGGGGAGVLDERSPWWREPGPWVLALFVLLVYFTRMDAVVLRHEEPHRGQVGLEMLQTGDWIVPRQQGTPFLSRPPLQNWAIAGLVVLRGGIDEVAIRLPSALGVLATVLLVYAYARRFLEPLGAFTAGAAFASMGQVLELGRKGETEAFYTFFVAASFLVWHAGAARGPLRASTWMAGYAFAALGTLTKGTQAPVYFAGVVGLYLLARGRWRELLRPAHFAGIALYGVIFGLWLVPFWSRMGLESVQKIFTHDVGQRFVDKDLGDTLAHLASFPLEVLGRTLPWSPLLLAYGSRALRRDLGAFREAAFFAAVVIALTFPTVWIPPGGKARYLMPIYPSLAILAAGVVQAAATASSAGYARAWRGVQRGGAALGLVATLALLGGPLLAEPSSALDQPLAFTLPASLLCAGCSLVLWRGAGGAGERAALGSVLSLAALVGLLGAGVLVNAHRNTAVDLRSQVAELRARMPEGARLRSLNWVSPLFVHYWGEPVERIDWWGGPLTEPPDTDYFLLDPSYADRSVEELQFRWELVQLFSCDFTRGREVKKPVYVGRVLPPP